MQLRSEMHWEEYGVADDVRLDLVGLLPRLRRFAYALTGDPSRAEDLVQEACARAFAHIHQFQPGTRLVSWMYKIIRNIWLNQERAQRSRGVIIDLETSPEPVGDDGRAIMESRLTLNRVLEALAQLPRDQQELIALICIEGVSYQEAADILDIPLGTVTSRLARGRRALYETAVEGPGALGGQHDEVN
jgi:RNA polymerase sigma-70 factor, ECF subfamily